MKKILLSLLAVLCSVGMWADETIYDFAAGTGTTDGTTGAPASFSQKTSFKLGGNAQYIIISPASGSFKKGDKIEVTGSCGTANKNMGLYFATAADGRTSGTPIYTTAETKNQSYTVTGTLDLSADAEKLYLFRYESTSTTITGVKITRADGKTSSDLTVSSTASVNIGASTDLNYTTSSIGTVSVTSSDENVATVSLDAANNKVTITGVAEGTATITISQAADDNYNAGSKSIAVTVTDPNTLIGYNHTSTVGDGITLSGSTAMNSIKIHTNKDAVDCIQLANGYTTKEVLNDNYIELSYEGGFKAGDKISIAGFFNNSDDTKESAADIFVKDDSGYEVLWTSEKFINGRSVNDDPVVQTYVLTVDADKLYIGRNGNTSTYIYSLKVVRPETIETKTITLGTNGFSTYASDYAFTASATAYKATYDGSTVTLEPIEGVIPAGEGVIFRGEEGKEVTITCLKTDAAAVEENSLVGVTSTTTAFEDGTNYVLASKGTTTAFVNMASGKTVADMVGKAYLNVPTSSNNAKVIYFADDATAINSVETEKSAATKKVLVNGQVRIVTANGTFNAAGAQVK